MASNPLTGPAGRPSPWGQRGGDVVPAGTPRIRNALIVPRAPVMPPVPTVPAAPAAMPDIPQAPEAERISPRVPVPKSDFPESEHAGLHKSMGEVFDHPGAQKYVHDLYNLVRQQHPDIAPRHLLETARDHYHAVRHGFMSPAFAGYSLARRARQRQLDAEQKPQEGRKE